MKAICSNCHKEFKLTYEFRFDLGAFCRFERYDAESIEVACPHCEHKEIV